MINANQHKSGDPPRIYVVQCPACLKARLNKYEDTPASKETIEIRGEERFVEVCCYCRHAYKMRDEKFALENLEKLAKSIGDDDTSTHKDVSLN